MFVDFLAVEPRKFLSRHAVTPRSSVATMGVKLAIVLGLLAFSAALADHSNSLDLASVDPDGLRIKIEYCVS